MGIKQHQVMADMEQGQSLEMVEKGSYWWSGKL